MKRYLLFSFHPEDKAWEEVDNTDYKKPGTAKARITQLRQRSSYWHRVYRILGLEVNVQTGAAHGWIEEELDYRPDDVKAHS